MACEFAARRAGVIGVAFDDAEIRAGSRAAVAGRAVERGIVPIAFQSAGWIVRILPVDRHIVFAGASVVGFARFPKGVGKSLVGDPFKAICGGAENRPPFLYQRAGATAVNEANPEGAMFKVSDEKGPVDEVLFLGVRDSGQMTSPRDRLFLRGIPVGCVSG